MTPSLPRIDENAFYSSALEHHNAGNITHARDLYRAILTQNSRHTGAIFGMGTLAMQVEQNEKAVDYIKQAIKFGPATSAMYINLGAALRKLDQNKKAVAAYNKAIKLDNRNAAAFYNKGRALQALDQYAEAKACYQRALDLSDTDADAWVNLGTVQIELEESDEALYAFDKAARLDPTIGAPYSNAAAILFDRGYYEISMVLINKALEVEPENTEFRFQLSSFFLMTEDLERGWPDFDLRFTEVEQAKQYRRPEPPPYWDGANLEDLKNKNLLVWTEQGLGEEILAVTLVPDLIRAGIQFTLECSPRMVPLFQKTFPDLKIIAWPDHDKTVAAANPPLDLQYPALSLMKTFRPTLDKITHQPRLLQPDQDSVTRLRNRYEALAQGRKIVGLSWRSGNTKLGQKKSIPILQLEPILRNEGVVFVNLQYGDCSAELKSVRKKLGVEIFSDPEVIPTGDLEPVLAQIAAMDLVITVSNTNAHFAGTLNVPTWVMFPKGYGQLWFWFKDRPDNPWYPSVRLFRQAKNINRDPLAWPKVIDQVATSLEEWIENPGAAGPANENSS